MDVVKDPSPIDPLHGIAGIAAGNIYVARAGAVAGTFEPELADGVKSVLETAQGETLEVKTRNSIAGTPTAAGSYLNPTDLATFSDLNSPTLRRYTFGDTLKKVRSHAGIVLLLPALLALLTAGAGLFFLFSSQSQPSVTTLADTAQSLVVWANQGAAGTSAARTEEAGLCLQKLEGHEVSVTPIPGVSCSPETNPWWKTATGGSIITGAIALLSAIVGLYALPIHYSFGKNPAK